MAMQEGALPADDSRAPQLTSGYGFSREETLYPAVLRTIQAQRYEDELLCLLVQAAASDRSWSRPWSRLLLPPTLHPNPTLSSARAALSLRSYPKVPRRGERAAQSALRSVALACAMSGHVQAAWACARARWHPEQLQRGLCPQPCTARGRARSSPWRLACGSAGAILEASLATPQPRCGDSAAHRARPGARIRRLWCFPPSSRPSQPAPPHHW